MWCLVLICVSNKQHYLSVKAREGRREAPYNYAPKPTHPFYFLLSRDRFNVLHNARPRYLLPCCMYFNKNVSTSSNMVFQFMKKKWTASTSSVPIPIQCLLPCYKKERLLTDGIFAPFLFCSACSAAVGLRVVSTSWICPTWLKIKLNTIVLCIAHSLKLLIESSVYYFGGGNWTAYSWLSIHFIQ